MRKSSVFVRACALALAGCGLAVSAHAETYYLDLDAYKAFSGELSLSQTLTYFTEGKSDFWYTKGSDGTKSYVTSAPDLTDASNSYFFGEAGTNLDIGKNLYIDSDFYGDSLTSGILEWPVASSTADPITVKFSNLSSDTFNGGFSGLNVRLEIENITHGTWRDGWSFGQAIVGREGWTPLGSLEVSGVWNISGSGGGVWSSIYVCGVENHGIYNPDAKINVLDGSTANGPVYGSLSYGTNNALDNWTSLNETSYVEVNSALGSAGFLVAGATASTGKMVVIFSGGDGDSSANGLLHEGYYQRPIADDGIVESFSLKSGGAKLALVMRSATDNGDGTYTFKNGTQIFTSDVVTFTGGVEMISGKLLINYSPATLGADVSHGTLKFAQGEGATTSFGNANANVGGKFIFDNIEVDGGGELIVRLDKSGSGIVFDQIELSAGGIEYAEGGAGEIVIDFGTNTAEYLADLIRVEASEGLKIIAYKEGQTSDVSFSAVLDSFEKDGVTYNFETFAGTDGLYAAYVAVPEPAEVAAVLGALFLAYAVYRRRK